MNSKDLLLRIIQTKPEISEFRLNKLAYLFDIACIQISGKQKTSFPYIWHYYGPFCIEIERVAWELKTDERIDINLRYGKDYEVRVHIPKEKEKRDIPQKESQILDYIIKKFGSMPLKELEKFVYSTPPMLEAQKKMKRHLKLNMKASVCSAEPLCDPEVVKMILDAEAAPKKRFIDSKIVVQKLKEISQHS